MITHCKIVSIFIRKLYVYRYIDKKYLSYAQVRYYCRIFGKFKNLIGNVLYLQIYSIFKRLLI